MRLLTIEWERISARFTEDQKNGDDVSRLSTSSPYEIYTTRCPFCGSDDGLSVVEVTFTYTNGHTVNIDVPLQANGFFLFDPLSESFGEISTENEKVFCKQCNEYFNLDLVSLEWQPSDSKSTL